jgi:hypothetical protein
VASLSEAMRVLAPHVVADQPGGHRCQGELDGLGRVVGLLPRLRALEGDVVLAQDLPQAFPTDRYPARAGVVGEVVGEFAQAPPGERLVEGFGSGAGRRDDERFVVVTTPDREPPRPATDQSSASLLGLHGDHCFDALHRDRNLG